MGKRAKGEGSIFKRDDGLWVGSVRTTGRAGGMRKAPKRGRGIRVDQTSASVVNVEQNINSQKTVHMANDGWNIENRTNNGRA